MNQIRSVSYGGGVQSTALLVLAAQGRIEHNLFLFANVGVRAENPDTLAYLVEHAMPFASKHDVELRELRWVDRTGKTRDLYDDLLRQDNSLTIPLRDTGGFGNRKCTQRYKIEVVARELKRRGATVELPAVVALGISTDELERAKPGVPKQQPWTLNTYPLLDLGLSRQDCANLITSAGLPVPPKSSCSFCPFQGPEQWQRQRLSKPDLFARNAELDRIMRDRHIRLRGDSAGLAHPTEPLPTAVLDQLSFGECDSGWCWT